MPPFLYVRFFEGLRALFFVAIFKDISLKRTPFTRRKYEKNRHFNNLATGNTFKYR